MSEFDQLLMRGAVEMAFNRWKAVGEQCVELSYIIQNGLELLGEGDLTGWIEKTREFEREYKETKIGTHKLIKQYLDEHNE